MHSILLLKRKFDHITAYVRDHLHWLPLQQQVKYKVSLLVYKCFHQAAPSYLAEMCIPVSATDNRCHLRSATHSDLAVPRVRLARYGRSFSVSGPLLWNSRPGSSTSQTGKIRKQKFLCVWSAAVELTTWQFHESDWQDTEEVSLCLVRCCGTHYH